MLLSEEDAMNKLNPYVVFDFSLPGSVRQTPEFAEHGKEVHGTRDVERKSPICDVASTSGDRTVDFCKGRPCPVRDPLIPRRIFHTAAKEKCRGGVIEVDRTTRKAPIVPLLILAVIVIIILTRSLARR